MSCRATTVTLLVLLASTAALDSAQNPRTLSTPGPETFSMRIVATGLENPWEVTWGPDARLWITERTAHRVTRVDPANGSRQTALTLDDVHQTVVQDGLMGMALHPDLLKGRGRDYVYLAYTYDADPGNAVARRLKVSRYTFTASTGLLGAPQSVLDNLPAGSDHGGGRLAFGPDGTLYLSRGDHGANFLANYCLPSRAQDVPDAGAVLARDWSTYEGKILRLNVDGTIPADNPLIRGVRSHIYSYGLRNVQGLTFGANGRLYASEHGPSTDDEVNLVQAGKNYGWPHVAGFNDDRGYVFANWAGASPEPCQSLKFDNLRPPSAVPLVKESAWHHPDFVAPLATFFTVPPGYDLAALGGATIGPGSIEAYTASAIPGWQSSLLVTGMRTGAVYRVPLNADGTAASGPPRQYFRRANRYRDTAVAPDGRRIFVVTDSAGSVLDEQWRRIEVQAEPGALLEFTYDAASRKEP